MKSLIAAASLALAVTASSAHAQDFPTRNVTLVVTQAAGGGMDATARLLARKMSEVLGQTVIVENKPGGAENVAIGYVSKANPDGYTHPAVLELDHRQPEPLQKPAL